MLRITGKVLGVTSEQRQGPTGPFTSNEIHMLDGLDKFVVSVDDRQFLPADWPKEGEEVDLKITVRAFSRRDGSAGVQMTTSGRAQAGLRAARPAAATG